MPGRYHGRTARHGDLNTRCSRATNRTYSNHRLESSRLSGCIDCTRSVSVGGCCNLNHGFLATELMALVLLVSLRHRPLFVAVSCRLSKTNRFTPGCILSACVLALVRELPVSGYFWRCVFGYGESNGLCCRLCLTFEQANPFDFCRYFARGFEQVGDADTSSLLNRILMKSARFMG